MTLVHESSYPELYTGGFNKTDPFGYSHKGKQLTAALSQATQPLVVAVDGAWGSGKTHFLRSWTGAHKTGATVVYFDAFERDYLDDPLVSLLYAVSERIEPSQREKWTKQVKRVVPFLSTVALNVVTSGAMSLVNDLADSAIAGIDAGAKQALDDYWAISQSREAALDQFREALKALVNDENGPNKLILVVDELDRCRPDYAVRLLEIMKHAFAVAEVHFVLGVNLDQLRHSVRAVYGQGFDAEKYLQRFIPVVMELRYAGAGHRSHQRVARYLHELDQHGNNNWLANMVEKIDPREEITFRDMQRLHTLGQLVRTPASYNDATCQAAMMILRICRPKWFEDMPPYADKILAFYRIDDSVFSKADTRSDLDWFSAHLMKTLNRIIPDQVAKEHGISSREYKTPFNQVMYDRIAAFKIS